MNQSNLSSQVVIKGVKSNGQPFEFPFNTQDTSLILSKMNLKSIDLTQLANCPNLKILDLKNNKLESIDLSPLTNCTKLVDIYLRVNMLSSIDLSPLQNKKELDYLGLSSNRLTSIDLTPLQSCDKFRSLSLRKNELTSLDLSPLQSLQNLRVLYLNKNRFTSLDLSPIEHIVAELVIFEVDKGTDTKGIAKPGLPAGAKKTFILVSICFFSSVFGYLLALYYLIRNKKKHALWYLLTGLFTTISIVFFWLSSFYDGPGGPGVMIATGIVNWLVAYFWLWAKITALEEQK